MGSVSSLLATLVDWHPQSPPDTHAIVVMGTLKGFPDPPALGSVGQSPPDTHAISGAAYVALGVEHFRHARFAEALEAFHAAARASDPPAPAPLAFNEGSALFALNRYAEAEQAFARAAGAGGKLASLALINAGHAALAEGDLPGARRYAEAVAAQPEAGAVEDGLEELRASIGSKDRDLWHQEVKSKRQSARAALGAGKVDVALAELQGVLNQARSRRVPPAEEADLVRDIGYALYRNGSHDQAAQYLRQASGLAPADPELHLLAARADYKRDELAAARAGFERALALNPDEETAETARAYLDAMAPGLRAGGGGLILSAGAGGGYDSNVALLAGALSEVLNAETAGGGGGFASLSAEAGYGWLLGRRGYVEAEYSFDQLAYVENKFDPYSLQVHSVGGQGEANVTRWLRVGTGAGADWQLVGLRDNRLFQRILGVDPWIAVDEGARTSTTLHLRLQGKDAASKDDQQYDGNRIEIKLGQKLRYRWLRGELATRHRRENIGTREGVQLDLLRTDLNGFYDIPYAYRSNALVGTFSLTAGHLRYRFDASVERIAYRGDNRLYTEVFKPALGRNEQHTVRSVHRIDDRLGLSNVVTWSLDDRFDVALRYDMIFNQSTVNFNFDNKNFFKHQVAFELSFDY